MKKLFIGLYGALAVVASCARTSVFSKIGESGATTPSSTETLSQTATDSHTNITTQTSTSTNSSTQSGTNTSTSSTSSTQTGTATQGVAATPTATVTNSPSNTVTNFPQTISAGATCSNNGTTGATSLVSAGGRHLLLSWTPSTNPAVDRYYVFLSTSSGMEDFTSPVLAVLGANACAVGINNLQDGTHYFAVVRSGNSSGTLDSNDTEAQGVTQNAVQIPATSAGLFASLTSYYDVIKSALGLGEITSIAGLFDYATNMGIHNQQVALLATLPSAGETRFYPDGTGIFPAGGYIYHVDSYGDLVAIAGTGVGGCTGDGGPATAATIHAYYLAIDAANSIYLSDQTCQSIRKITSQGIISTIAGLGNGTAGFTADGQPALGNALNLPDAVELDAQGNLLFAEENTHRIRKITTAGILATVAGNGTSGSTGNNGAATSATLTKPSEVRYMNGNIWIGDYGNSTVREITSDGIIHASQSIGYPFGIALDTAGNAYVCSNNAHAVYKIDTTNTLTTLAGTFFGYRGDGTPLASSAFEYPSALGIDSGGNLYVSSGTPGGVQMIGTDGYLHNWAGSIPPVSLGYSGDGAPATTAYINQPSGLTLDSKQNLYFADSGNYRVRMVNSMGIISTFAGNGTSGFTGDGGLATGANIGAPTGVILDSFGNLFVSDNSGTIRKILTSGIITTYAGTGTSGYAGDGGAATSAQMKQPWQMALDTSGNLYVADYTGNRVREIFANTGIISTLAGNGTASHSGDGGAASSAQLAKPVGIALDASGNIYISEFTGNSIRKISGSTGVISTVIGTGTAGYTGDGGVATSATLHGPCELALDASGNLYIADYFNNAIRMVNTSGIISTVAGNGTYGFGGDGGAATAASLYGPWGLVLDSNGNLYIGDVVGDRVRFLKRH